LADWNHCCQIEKGRTTIGTTEMRIIHLSTNDVRGGAARAAYRLHRGLCRQGLESLMFVAHRGSDDPSVTSYVPPMDFPSGLRRVLRRGLIWRDFMRYENSRRSADVSFSDCRSEYGAALLKQLPSCDLINLHWIAGFVDYRSFFARVPSHIPIVWTLHDMNPFTGGCHYDEDCGRFVECCGGCPQLGSNDLHDLSRQIWRRKRNIFQQIEPDTLHIVTSSLWLTEEAKRSSLLGRFPISAIPYGLDTDIFSPRNRAVAREAFQIPENARVVLFVAHSALDRRKGFTLLAEALAGMGGIDDLFLLSLGEGKPALKVEIPHLHLGYIANERILSLVYSAANVFVIPSLQEAFGQTALESMACGTPVVGFDVGGIPDFVRHGKTGLLAPLRDVRELRSAIVELLQDPAKRDEMAAHCRRVAQEEYSYQVQVRRYVDLYETIRGEQIGQP
jgi:glycosyltransferase involved in cell wall biosynthesis